MGNINIFDTGLHTGWVYLCKQNATSLVGHMLRIHTAAVEGIDLDLAAGSGMGPIYQQCTMAQVGTGLGHTPAGS